jgi:hypothetical protein
MARTFPRFRPALDGFEPRLVPAAGWSPIPAGTVVVAPEDGGSPKIHLMDPVTGRTVRTVIGYEGQFRGGIHAELGDVTHDGVPDLVFAPGGGGGPRVRVVDGATGDVIADVMVYEETFRGGVDVAVGDVNNDGYADVITGTGNGGGPRVRVLDGKSIADGADAPDVLYDFFPYEDTFRGGVFVGTGDVNGDSDSDIITGTGVGGGPRVVVFDGQTGDVLKDFFAFGPSVRTGVRVGSGDVDDDGDDDVLVGAGPGGGPQVRAISGRTGAELASFFGDDGASRTGVHVHGQDLNGDGVDDILVQARHGNKDVARGFDDRGTHLEDMEAGDD